MPLRRLALLLVLLLLVTGAARIGWVAGHQPLLGYANQFDMGRTSACFGLWPNLPEPARYEANREAPIAQYVEGAHRAGECYVSSELLFAGIAMASWKLAADAGLASASTMDLRYVGAVKALALLLAALGFTWLLRGRPVWMLLHAAVFALVLADPVVTLWLNTLYTEFSAVFFAYLAVMCLLMIVGNLPDRGGWYLGFGAALLGLGMSRQQHTLLPAYLALLAWPAIRQARPRLVWAIGGIAVAVIVLQAAIIVRPPTIAAANNVNVVLGTLLPAARDQDRALARLELPPDCAASIGATWYVTMGEVLGLRCPDIMTLPRLQVIKLLAAEPMIVVRALAKAAPLVQPAVLQYVGIEAGKAYGALQDLRSPFAASVGKAVERLPVAVWLGILLAALLAFAVSAGAWLATTLRRGTPTPEAALVSALTGIFAYALLTSILGDGMVELPRHANLGHVALYALAVLGAVLLPLRLGAAITGRGTMQPEDAGAGAPWFALALTAALAAVPLASPLWLPVWQRQPLAIGVVDEPARNVFSTATVTLHGWVLDPFGPARAVTVVNGTLRLDGRVWQHPLDPAGAALAWVLPTYADPASARFETVIDTTAFGSAPISVRTYARNAAGVLTEIDRRVLTQSPR